MPDKTGVVELERDGRGLEFVAVVEAQTEDAFPGIGCLGEADRLVAVDENEGLLSLGGDNDVSAP